MTHYKNKTNINLNLVLISTKAIINKLLKIFIIFKTNTNFTLKKQNILQPCYKQPSNCRNSMSHLLNFFFEFINI